jgi:excisionase family DNA binding protein
MSRETSKLKSSVALQLPVLPPRPQALPIQQRYGVTVQTAAAYIGISRSRIYELLAAGDLDGKIIHGRRIVVVESLLRMVGAAPDTRRNAAA